MSDEDDVLDDDLVDEDEVVDSDEADEDEEYDDYDEDVEDNLIEIKESELDILEYRSKKLRFLEKAGVDNWEGYDIAMEDMANFEEDIDE
jgi:hypothetical protein